MIYDTDTIQYIAVTRDSVYGTITRAASVDYNCVIEDTNRIKRGDKGQEVQANALILIDSTFTGAKGDIIKLYKKFGTLTGDTREYEIIEIFETGGMIASHKEVLI